MDIITNLNELENVKPSAVAIGKFDGFHLGHRELLARLTRQRRNGLQTLIFTFDPSPEQFFSGGKLKELSTRQEKLSLFERMGIDTVVEFPMNAETAATDPEYFIREVLVRKLNARYIVAGPDLSFGAQGRGNFELLDRLAAECGYETCRISKVQYLDEEISSTRVRKLVHEGKMEEATGCLGMPYAVCGTVAHGKELGRSIGIPTINILPEEPKLLPPFGVYYSSVRVFWNGFGDLSSKSFRGMTNIGMKPTVTKDRKICAETYLYDFDGDLYGKDVEISLLTYRRPEKKFSGLEELRAAMEEDVAAGREFFEMDAETDEDM